MENEESKPIYSAVFTLSPKTDTTAYYKVGEHQIHASFLNLIGQFNPTLSVRLHDEPRYRPFTISTLREISTSRGQTVLQKEQLRYLRITLLDGGSLWNQLYTYFLEAGPTHIQLGGTALQIIQILSSPETDLTGWAGTTDWQTLFTLPAKQSVTIHFVSPTAFSWGNRRFVLFPEPFLLWENLLHTWNRYAPECYNIERKGFRESLLKTIQVTHCSLHTKTLHYPTYTQKGFIGRCRFTFHAQDDLTSLLTTLAAFAHYAGVGYKTTMGMGQVQVSFDDQASAILPDSTPVSKQLR